MSSPCSPAELLLSQQTALAPLEDDIRQVTLLLEIYKTAYTGHYKLYAVYSIYSIAYTIL